MELAELTGEALKEIRVRPVEPSEEGRYQEQMARHHYLGALAKIGETVWYVEADAPKRVFVRPLCRDARTQLTHPDRDRLQLTGAPKIMLNSEQMRKLPQCFKTIPDPRRSQGRRHRLPVVLSIAAGATLCGMHGYKAFSD